VEQLALRLVLAPLRIECSERLEHQRGRHDANLVALGPAEASERGFAAWARKSRAALGALALSVALPLVPSTRSQCDELPVPEAVGAHSPSS
jgi:hypothetical protein